MVDRGWLGGKKDLSFVDDRVLSQAPIDEARALPRGFTPGENDVICSKGMEGMNHVGNIRFRALVEENVERYSSATTKLEKSLVVSSIIDTVRHRAADSSGFVRHDIQTNLWYLVPDKQAREKAGQAFRSILRKRGNTSYAPRKRSSPSCKRGLSRSPSRSKQDGEPPSLNGVGPLLPSASSFSGRIVDNIALSGDATTLGPDTKSAEGRISPIPFHEAFFHGLDSFIGLEKRQVASDNDNKPMYMVHSFQKDDVQAGAHFTEDSSASNALASLLHKLDPPPDVARDPEDGLEELMPTAKKEIPTESLREEGLKGKGETSHAADLNSSLPKNDDGLSSSAKQVASYLPEQKNS